MLLRLVLMSVFDGGLSSRDIDRRTQTDNGYKFSKNQNQLKNFASLPLLSNKKKKDYTKMNRIFPNKI